MQTYVDTLNEAGLDYDARLVTYGECSFIGGQQAICEILASGAPFTGVVANNDRSGFGVVNLCTNNLNG